MFSVALKNRLQHQCYQPLRQWKHLRGSMPVQKIADRFINYYLFTLFILPHFVCNVEFGLSESTELLVDPCILYSPVVPLMALSGLLICRRLIFSKKIKETKY